MYVGGGRIKKRRRVDTIGLRPRYSSLKYRRVALYNNERHLVRVRRVRTYVYRVLLFVINHCPRSLKSVGSSGGKKKRKSPRQKHSAYMLSRTMGKRDITYTPSYVVIFPSSDRTDRHAVMTATDLMRQRRSDGTAVG